jgi:hypothetical protein
MAEVPEKLKGLQDPVALYNGAGVAFTITTETGKRLRVQCSLAELGDIFGFLANIAKYAGEMSGVPTPPLPQGQNYLVPIPVEGMALQTAGAPPGESLLVIRLTGFDMAFSLPNSGIIRLADDFVRASRSLLGEDQGPKN